MAALIQFGSHSWGYILGSTPLTLPRYYSHLFSLRLLGSRRLQSFRFLVRQRDLAVSASSGVGGQSHSLEVNSWEFLQSVSLIYLIPRTDRGNRIEETVER